MEARSIVFSKFNKSNVLLFAPILLLFSCKLPCHAYKWVTYDADGTKHIHAPFVNVAVKKHADGTKDVDVKAPFTKVHNPAGEDNSRVHAPFTDIEPKPVKKPSQSAAPHLVPSSPGKTYSSANKKAGESGTKASSSTKSSASKVKKSVAPKSSKESPET
jgi:hypothetical protein